MSHNFSEQGSGFLMNASDLHINAKVKIVITQEGQNVGS